jgi:hypothetical protein
MSDPQEGSDPRAKTQRLDDERTPFNGDVRRPERLTPPGSEQTPPVNPGWRRVYQGQRRAPNRAGLPTSPQEFQLWLQRGGWIYILGLAAFLVLLLIVVLFITGGEESQAGREVELVRPTVTTAALSSASVATNATQPIAPTALVVPTVVPQRFVVTGTSGQGLFLRSEASTASTIITTLPEGTVLEQIGAEVLAPDRLWRHVRTPDGREGYVAGDFLTKVP